MPVGRRKDGLPEFSTNHQTTHWLQHWLMKYLSRQSHITCFSCPPPPPPLSWQQKSYAVSADRMNPDRWTTLQKSLVMRPHHKNKTERVQLILSAVCKHVQPAQTGEVKTHLDTWAPAWTCAGVCLISTYSDLHIAPPPSPSSEYNSAQYYWLQTMINNNNIDKNGTLALTSDLICRPLCTLWFIQYHNHAWVHLVWKKGVGGGGWGSMSALMSREKTSHLQILCWQSTGEQTGVMPRRPLIRRLTCSLASVQQ